MSETKQQTIHIMVEKAEILLVDDHALILEGICQILKRIPEVVVADAVTTGKEADCSA